LPYCERTILLTNRAQDSDSADRAPNPRARRLELRTPAIWEQVLEAISIRG
jgi:hypothetical protein